MNAKKVASFLLCGSAFTQRNVTSLLLVGVFFGVYVFAGGKITTDLPPMYKKGGLGGAAKPAQEAPNANLPPELTMGESKEVLGVKPTEDRQARVESVQKRGRLFTKEETQTLEEEPIDEDMLVQGADFTNRREQWKLERAEKKPTDSLSAIEERLKIRRR